MEICPWYIIDKEHIKNSMDKNNNFDLINT